MTPKPTALLVSDLEELAARLESGCDHLSGPAFGAGCCAYRADAAKVRMALGLITAEPSYHIVRNVDGHEFYGEYAFMAMTDADDWMAVEESERDDDEVYEALACYPVKRRRYFGSRLCPTCQGEGTSGEVGPPITSTDSLPSLLNCATCGGSGERDSDYEEI